jgi:molecular chaperone GrpE
MKMKTNDKHDSKSHPTAAGPTQAAAPASDEVTEWKTKYLRALADYQNLEKRSSEHVAEARKFAAEIILLRLLPVVDTFAKVKAHVNDMGFDLAFKEMEAVLSEQGVTKIEVVGKEFDPHTMECIEVVEGKDNMVVEETLAGYEFRGKVLRVAQVKVGKSTQHVQ